MRTKHEILIRVLKRSRNFFIAVLVLPFLMLLEALDFWAQPAWLFPVATMAVVGVGMRATYMNIADCQELLDSEMWAPRDSNPESAG